MSELEYYAGEFTDSDLDALAEAGDYYLDEPGFFLVPTQDEMRVLARERLYWASRGFGRSGTQLRACAPSEA